MINVNNINKQYENYEYVQRKGIGNRNSICDGIAESITWSFQNTYLRDYGEIQPYDINVRLIGGNTSPEFEGGTIDEVSTIVIEGYVAPCSQDFNDVAIDSVVEFLGDATPMFDNNNIVSALKEGVLNPKEEDKNTFKRTLNDYGIGYSSNSILENLVFSIENDFFFEARNYPTSPIGYDINVTGIRLKDNIDISINCAMIDEFLTDIYEYESTIAELKETLIETIDKIFELNNTETPFSIKINENCEYLTCMGTFAEKYIGTSRCGNGCNGLINPAHPIQYVSGKDSQYSVNKIYSILATQISDILTNNEDFKEAEIFMLSEIGEPILEPKLVNVNLNCDTEDFDVATVVEELIPVLDINDYPTF